MSEFNLPKPGRHHTDSTATRTGTPSCETASPACALSAAPIRRGRLRVITGLLPRRLLAALATALGLAAVAPAQEAAEVKITSVRLDGGGATVALKFNSEAGTTYRVEISPALGAGTWVDAGVSVEGDDGEQGFDIPTAGLGGTHFFRVTAAAASPTGFVLIPAGTFQMGDSFNEGLSRERPVHAVNVSAFFMQTTETTRAEWEEVRTWALARGYNFDNAGAGKAADHPVQSVSWYDVVKWCNARSQKEGLTPCYYTNTAKTTVYKTGQLDVENTMVKWTANGYRLPTEAEWEKAGRGGLAGRRFPWGDQITHSLANYESSTRWAYDTSPTRGDHPAYQAGGTPYTSPVGSFAPNGYGLYDMAGNVWEWCWDWRDVRFSYYSSSPASDPRGPGSGSYRMFRGGGWTGNAYSCRAALRGHYAPFDANAGMGFRLARSSVP